MDNFTHEELKVPMQPGAATCKASALHEMHSASSLEWAHVCLRARVVELDNQKDLDVASKQRMMLLQVMVQIIDVEIEKAADAASEWWQKYRALKGAKHEHLPAESNG